MRTSFSIRRIRLTHKAAAATLCAVRAGCATPAPSKYGTPQSQSGLPSKPQNCPNIAAPPDLIKQPNYRQIEVSAQSQNNQPFPKLTAKDLRLYQADKQLQIAFSKPQPATVGILVDIPPARAGRSKLNFQHIQTQLDWRFPPFGPNPLTCEGRGGGREIP